MSDIDTEFENYKKDARIPCRYGVKCYQKNPVHHNKYKHPPKKRFHRKDNADQGPSKKIKVENKLEKNNEELNLELLSTSDDSDSNDEECSAESKHKETISEKMEENCTLDNKESSSERTADENVPPQSQDHQNGSFSEKPESSTSGTSGDSLDPRKIIKETFLVDMPEDFYQFWEYCSELKSNNPAEALKDIGLKLVGPYDVLAGKFRNVKKSPEEYLRHWRYYYDPPEFQTVLKGDDKTGYHIGYFRDSPDEPPVFLLGNFGLREGVFTKLGDNIFAAVCAYLEDLRRSGDPFKKMCIGKFVVSLKKEADRLNLSLSSHSEKIKKRENKVIAKTANKIGLVVPYNKKTQVGYRELAMSDKEILTLLNRLKNASPEQRTKCLSDLQPVLTYASIAIDECDFGTGIKLGWDILCHGVDSLNATIAQFLSSSYKLLNKEAFAKIAETHMSNRKRSSSLCVL